MAIVVYHHPFSRAMGTVWMLEEVGVPYELKWIDIHKGAQKQPDVLALNPMGKLPILVDGDAVVTESAAIGLYLADKYAPGKLAPALDDPARGTYLRWSFFAPSVIEPGVMAKSGGWVTKPSAVGWGEYDAMILAMESAIAGRDYLLGDRFSMADVIFGGCLRFMLGFKMIEPNATFQGYVDRLMKRPASQRADERNDAIAKEHGLR